MVAVIEQETVPAAIEATVNYILDNGEKLFTFTGGPGSLDVRTGGTPDPRRVTIRNARQQAARLCSTVTGSVSCTTTPRSPTSSTRTKCAKSTTPRWKPW